MVAGLIATTVVPSHGSDATAENYINGSSSRRRNSSRSWKRSDSNSRGRSSCSNSNSKGRRQASSSKCSSRPSRHEMHPPTATAGTEKHFQPQPLNTRGFDNIELLSIGEEQWQNWWWKMKTVVSGRNKDWAGGPFTTWRSDLCFPLNSPQLIRAHFRHVGRACDRILRRVAERSCVQKNTTCHACWNVKGLSPSLWVVAASLCMHNSCGTHCGHHHLQSISACLECASPQQLTCSVVSCVGMSVRAWR